MDYSSAQKLVDAYESTGDANNEADIVIRTLPDSERAVHLRGLGDKMGHLWLKLQLPVVCEH